MAKATLNVNRPKPVVVPPPSVSVTLELSLEEALWLKALTGDVGTGPLGKTEDLNSRIYSALSSAGVGTIQSPGTGRTFIEVNGKKVFGEINEIVRDYLKSL